jgi:glycosyltransferase involved in cell wall biosynthesis
MPPLSPHTHSRAAHVVSGLAQPASCVDDFNNSRSSTLTPSPPIRVGFVLHGLQVAGAEVLVTQIIQRLRKRIQPTIFCLDSAGALSDQLTDVEIISLERRPGWDFRVAWRMVGHIRRLGIEVLHAHQYSPFFYAALAKVLTRGSVRLVFTEHGRHFPDRVSPLRRAGNRLLLQHLANAVNAVSAFSADSLASQDGFCRHQIEVIENGIDVERFHSSAGLPVDLDLSRRYVVHIARFHPIKDQATLLKAFEQVAKIFPDVDLLMVGDGELRNELVRLGKDLGLEERVRFLGIRQDVPSILRVAKVFVLTSQSEGAPLTLLEAMAVGLPVVVTAVGGMPEIVRDGVDGILAQRGDANAIASALIRLLENPGAASAMGAAAAQRIREYYTIDRAVERYYRLYVGLAGRA